MGGLIKGDDGLPAEVVRPWAKEKHELLCNYIQISSATRRKYLPPDNQGGAAYVDLFCSTGRCFVKDTGEWIDGSPVAAWKRSVENGTPFTRVIISDADGERVNACAERLARLEAPVFATVGLAKNVAFWARQRIPPHGLNFAFLDPYSLGALDFDIIKTLALIKRMDMLVHVSTMDLQRNQNLYLSSDTSAFDAFAPGWRDVLSVRSMIGTREDLLEYWRDLVSMTGIWTSEDVRLVRGTRGQKLYWLLLAAGHKLAHQFWKSVVPKNGQQSMDF